MTTRAVPPATEQEVRQLVLRLRLEIGVTNALAIAVLMVGAVIFPPPGEDIVAVGVRVIALANIPVFLAAVVLSQRMAKPLTDWLRTGEAGRDAPPEVQRLVVAHPALQALIIIAVWWLAAIGFGIANAVVADEQPVRAFAQTAVAAGAAGLVASALSFLTAQRILGRWYGHFFVEREPTRLGVPSSKVRRRLVVAYVLGGAVPLALLGTLVSQRIDEPRGLERLELVVWFMVGVGIVAGLFLTLSVRQSIVRPLELIRRAAERVREGDLSVSVPVESADELAELSVAFNSMVEGLRERRRIEDLFGRHVGDAVVERALREGVVLGGQRRVASVLLLDLVGFSRLSEDLPPEEVVRRLNLVFDVAVDEVTLRHGLVNKFMGDAVLAVFGAPFDDPDHPRHAVETATAVATRLDAAGVGYGIGVSTGNVVAGNVGTEERFEYTVVGDAVNEAARLQELTRERPERVLVSGRTARAMRTSDGLVRLTSEQLRGRSHPTEIFTPTPV